MPSPGCYRNRFGSIGKLGDSLGLPRAKNWRYKKYSNDWLLKKLVDFAEKIGHTPTTIEIDAALDMPSSDMYRKRFSSYESALRMAKLELPFSEQENDALLKLLWDYGQRIGRVPSKRDVDKEPSLPSSALFMKRFGSFKKAILAAGFTNIASSGRRRSTS